MVRPKKQKQKQNTGVRVGAKNEIPGVRIENFLHKSNCPSASISHSPITLHVASGNNDEIHTPPWGASVHTQRSTSILTHHPPKRGAPSLHDPMTLQWAGPWALCIVIKETLTERQYQKRVQPTLLTHKCGKSGQERQ